MTERDAEGEWSQCGSHEVTIPARAAIAHASPSHILAATSLDDRVVVAHSRNRLFADLFLLSRARVPGLRSFEANVVAGSQVPKSVESNSGLELAGAVSSRDFGVGARDVAVAAKQMAAVRSVDVEEEKLALMMLEGHDYQ